MGCPHTLVGAGMTGIQGGGDECGGSWVPGGAGRGLSGGDGGKEEPRAARGGRGAGR